jgi:WD40 repeat protein
MTAHVEETGSWRALTRRLALVVTTAVVVGLCLIAAGLIAASPASAANTCPGRNGNVAVIASPGPEAEVIGILGPNRQLRTVYESRGESALFGLSFSCNGKEIVYTEDNGADCRHLGIFNLAADKPRLYKIPGGWTTQFPTPHLCVGNAAYLSNGTMAFSASSGEGGAGTYAVHVDGSHLHRLFGRQEIAASPDGRWFIATDPGGNFRKLYLLNGKGKVIRPLTRTSPKGSEYLNPHFSPDGRWIVYEELHFLGASQHGTIYVVRRDGTHRRRLTFGSESASQPTFSPDGRWIAFTRSKDKPNGNVYAMSVSHPSTVRKLGLSWGYQDPAWAPK